MNIFQIVDNYLLCRMNGETLCIYPWGENSIRVVSSMMAQPVLTDWALLPPQPCKSKMEISENTAVVTVGKLRAEVRLMSNHLELTYYNQKGDVLLKERGPCGALHLSPRKFKPIIGGDYRLTVSFLATEGEKLYGMGQYQQEIFDLKDCTFELAHRNSQASIPFVLSNKGYGFFWHNPAIGKASFNKNGTEWYAESTKQMDYWITAGDTPAEIEEAYACTTGKVPMMPEYGMGFWQCKLRYWNQEQLLDVAREYKRRGIPLSVIVCDFFHWPNLGDFRFDEEFFPDPKAMAAELEDMGIKLMVSVWPQIGLQSENYKAMQTEGLLVKPEAGINICMDIGGSSNFYDPTNERARAFVWQKCRQNYYDKGISLFWLDEAEPEYGVYDFDNYRYAAGSNLQVGNVFPQLYTRTFYDGLTAEGEKNVLNLVRCAWAGSQRYGALVWSGDIQSDFESFRKQICAGLHMGLCGIPWWTTDIGGFSGGDPKDTAFRELLVRWFEYAAFCPVMRLHGDRIPGTELRRKDGSPVMFTGADNEIWSFGDEAYAILKRHVEFRETMRPYIRELMKAAHEHGTPAMRTLFYEFPQDSACWEIGDEFLFGPDVLIAPVTEMGAGCREVYLPAGANWTELHSGKVLTGGQTVTADAPLTRIPVYIKSGKHADWVGLL